MNDRVPLYLGAAALAVVTGVVFVGAGAVAVYALTRDTTPQPLTIVQRLTPAQNRIAAQIVRMTRARGLPASIAGALVANAYAESKLDPFAQGDVVDGRPTAIGLFQLSDFNETGGGWGMTVEQRMVPELNIERFLDLVEGTDGERTRSAAAKGASIGRLTEIVSDDVERPRDKAAERVRRRTIALRLFGIPAESAGTRIVYA